jgi:glycosyltransferase 2 family protein
VAVRPLLLRGLVSLGVLGLLVWILDLERVPAMLLQMDPLWILLALGITVLQTTLSAWRWCFTASRLGMHLPLGVAVREYYLGTFLNQLLPGGVMGDVTRAWRHTRSGHGSPRPGPAFRAVILERASGQVIMFAVALVSLGMLRKVREAVGEGTAGGFAAAPVPASGGPPGLLLAGAGVLLSLVTVVTLRRRRRVKSGPVPGGRGSARRAIWTDTREALLSPRALPLQLGSSLLVVGSYLAVYLLGARALGIETPLSLLLPLVAPVLMAMLIPLTLAGWGVREGAAALVWTAAGLPATEGVAISVAYGLLVLVSTLPGLPVLAGVISRGRGPDRRAGPSPGGSDGTGDAALRPGSPPEPG